MWGVLVHNIAFERWKSFRFIFVMLAWGTVSFFPILFGGIQSGTMKGISSALAAVPMLIVSHVLIAYYIDPFYNRAIPYDRRIDILSFGAITVSWQIAWSLIYMIEWIWNPANFDKFPANTEVYAAWGLLLGGALMVTPGGAAYFTGDPSNWLSAITVGVHTHLNYLLAFAMMAPIIDEVRKFIMGHRGEDGSGDRNHHHPQMPSSVVSLFSPESAYDNPGDKQHEGGSLRASTTTTVPTSPVLSPSSLYSRSLQANKPLIMKPKLGAD